MVCPSLWCSYCQRDLYDRCLEGVGCGLKGHKRALKKARSQVKAQCILQEARAQMTESSPMKSIQDAIQTIAEEQEAKEDRD